jgi:hypothetical protein
MSKDIANVINDCVYNFMNTGSWRMFEGAYSFKNITEFKSLFKKIPKEQISDICISELCHGHGTGVFFIFRYDHHGYDAYRILYRYLTDDNEPYEEPLDVLTIVDPCVKYLASKLHEFTSLKRLFLFSNDEDDCSDYDFSYGHWTLKPKSLKSVYLNFRRNCGFVVEDNFKPEFIEGLDVAVKCDYCCAFCLYDEIVEYEGDHMCKRCRMTHREKYEK